MNSIIMFNYGRGKDHNYCDIIMVLLIAHKSWTNINYIIDDIHHKIMQEADNNNVV